MLIFDNTISCHLQPIYQEISLVEFRIYLFDVISLNNFNQIVASPRTSESVARNGFLEKILNQQNILNANNL